MLLSKSARMVFCNWDKVLNEFRGITSVDVVSHVSAVELFKELRDLRVVALVYEGNRQFTVDVLNQDVLNFLIDASKYEMLRIRSRKGRSK